VNLTIRTFGTLGTISTDADAPAYREHAFARALDVSACDLAVMVDESDLDDDRAEAILDAAGALCDVPAGETCYVYDCGVWHRGVIEE